MKNINAGKAENKNKVVRVTVRCPGCRRHAIFEPFPDVRDVWVPDRSINLGQRRCPHPECRTHVFVVAQDDGKVIATFPAETIDFDQTDIPVRIKAALEEAIACHAIGCFRASAIMVRRTLEELCDDLKSTGGNLKDRLAGLRAKIIIPNDLLEGLDDLRLLGNDAAHIEAKVYDEIGKDEVEAAIDVAKEVLKATYQYSSLVNRLRALKKVPPSAP